MDLLSRQDAIATGKYLYYTGEPCKHGHVAPRYTKTCMCTTCHKAANAKVTIKLNLGVMGFRPFKTLAHPADHKALTDYAALLAAQRGVKLPDAPPAPTPATASTTIAERIAQTHQAITGLSEQQLKEVYVPKEFR